MPACVLYEDEHLLVVNKPAGLNTHSPNPFASEGIYDWLRNREPRWAELAIVHRLDKETSGVLVFSKSSLANRSLTHQFTNRVIEKRYVLVTDRAVKRETFTVHGVIVRAGERYLHRPTHAGGDVAETRFHVSLREKLWVELEAYPVTGRTHQIRVHAAEAGIPVLGDKLYGGATFARLCLHAAEIRFEHPRDGSPVRFEAPVDFDADSRLGLRSSLIPMRDTNAYRLIHGASDGWAGWYVDRLGDFLLSEAGEQEVSPARRGALAELCDQLGLKGAYHKPSVRSVRRIQKITASPHHILGAVAPDRFLIRENGLHFEMSFQEGYSTGLFLDQRDNRRRLLTGHVAPRFSLWEPTPGSEATSKPGGTTSKATPEVLNTFAYTCGFSVCAAKAGARVTSLDLSRNYLEWGQQNFRLNGLDPVGHDFIYGDVFDWSKRLKKKGRTFDLILLDPPTFSQSKASGTFRVRQDYGKLVMAIVPLLRKPGVLFCSANSAEWDPEDFLAEIQSAVANAGRKIVQQHYAPQPPDFPISREEPGYLKTAWLLLAKA